MDHRTSILRCLPSAVAAELADLTVGQWNAVRDIRLYAEASAVISTADGNRLLATTVSASEVRESLILLCGRAVHTHQEELRQGFITTAEGVRVGVAGTAVIRDGQITSYRDITSLCIRLPHVIDGCASPLIPLVENGGAGQGILLCGAPGCGKTTVLRDLARRLSVRKRVAVIDERHELATGGLLSMCDVLCGCPKTVGILQAVRTLSPDMVIADELGDEQEWRAVLSSTFLGVCVIASVHAVSERELFTRSYAREALRQGGFAWLAFLPPREHIGQPMRLRKVEELFENRRNSHDRLCVRGNRMDRYPPLV